MIKTKLNSLQLQDGHIQPHFNCLVIVSSINLCPQGDIVERKDDKNNIYNETPPSLILSGWGNNSQTASNNLKRYNSHFTSPDSKDEPDGSKDNNRATRSTIKPHG